MQREKGKVGGRVDVEAGAGAPGVEDLHRIAGLVFEQPREAVVPVHFGDGCRRALRLGEGGPIAGVAVVGERHRAPALVVERAHQGADRVRGEQRGARAAEVEHLVEAVPGDNVREPPPEVKGRAGRVIVADQARQVGKPVAAGRRRDDRLDAGVVEGVDQVQGGSALRLAHEPLQRRRPFRPGHDDGGGCVGH
ncbi:MAG: hypothetical protein M5R40_15165 [Anaerolineae bacterium]|nr:hypothetical protein [Anaerolineae bacterium]